MTVRIQQQDFDLSGELKRYRNGRADAGVVVSFVGLVRDINTGHSIDAMTLEHYPGMTEKILAEIEASA